jgi:hypothetical protein
MDVFERDAEPHLLYEVYAWELYLFVECHTLEARVYDRWATTLINHCRGGTQCRECDHLPGVPLRG